MDFRYILNPPSQQELQEQQARQAQQYQQDQDRQDRLRELPWEGELPLPRRFFSMGHTPSFRLRPRGRAQSPNRGGAPY